MDGTTWKRAKQIFHEAVETPGSEQSRYVAAACGEEQELRAQVQASSLTSRMLCKIWNNTRRHGLVMNEL